MSASKFSKATVCFVCFSLIFAVALIAAFSCGIIEIPAFSSEISAEAATATSTAPLEDGQVPSSHQPSGTGTTNIAEIRSNPSGTYHLTGDMTVDSFDSSTVFTGTLDGCGNTIEIIASKNDNGNEGAGLFWGLDGAKIKNVVINVTTFAYGNVSTKENRKVGIIAAYMINNTTIDNVKVNLNYDPTDYDEGNGMVDNNTYYTDTTSQNNKTYYTYFGGIVASSESGTNTIKNTTVINASTGGAGVSVCVRNGASGWSAPTSYVAMGLFVGTVISKDSKATLNLTNIRVNFKDDTDKNEQPKMSAIHYQTSSGTRRNYSGMILGWAQSDTTVNVDGIIYDYNAKFGEVDLVSKNFGSVQFGALYGHNQGTIYVKDLYSYKSTGASCWYDGHQNTVRGVILTDGYVAGFDKSNSDNIIIKTTYNAPTSSDLNAYVSIAGQSRYILDAVMCSDDNRMSDGAVAYVSVPKSGNSHTGYDPEDKSSYNDKQITFTKADTSGTVSIESSTEKTYDGTNVSAYRSLTLSNGTTFPSAYTAQTVDKVAGTYIYKFTGVGTSYNTVRYNGLTYLYDGNDNVFKPNNNVDIEKDQSFRILPRSATVSLTGGTIVYGQSAEEVATSNGKPTINSLVSNDDIDSFSVSSGYVPCAQNAGETVNVGYTFVIKDSSGRDISASYNITGTVAMTVTKRTVTLNIEAKSSQYGDPIATLTAALQEGSSFAGTDTAETVYKLSTTATNMSSVGNYDITGSVLDTNYDITFEGGTNAYTITARVVTINWCENKFTYNGGVQAVTAYYKDINNAEVALAVTVKADGAEAEFRNAGNYTVTRFARNSNRGLRDKESRKRYRYHGRSHRLYLYG